MSHLSPPMPIREESRPGTKRPVRRLVAAALTAMALLVPLVSYQASPASADTSPQAPQSAIPTVSADALPTAQIGQGVVWDQTIVGNTVYAVGEFTTARPAGVAAGGTGEVARSNALAYNITTGALLSWAPTLNGAGKTIKASADGTALYIGGSFTTVNGTARNRLAAVNPSTGALITAFNPNPNARVNVISVAGSTIYVGGIFTTVGGAARTRLAAVSATTGAVQPWAPSADAEVLSMTVPPNANQVVVGGHFNNLNTTTASGLGSISTVDGSVVPFAINQIIQDGGDAAGVTSLSSDATQVYGTGYTFGPGNFEGTFAASSNGGNEVFITGCRGDTYDATPIGNVLYSVSHSHDCSAIGGNPTTDPWTFQHAWATTTTAASSGLTNVASPFGANFVGQPAPEILHWLPTFTNGTYTGKTQAAWTIEGNSQYVVAGGEFPTVNGTAQQGLVRFGVSTASGVPNTQGPNSVVLASAQVPTLVAIGAGRVRVSWKAAWDRDNRNLSYEVLRGATTSTATVISTQKLDSTWYNRPQMYVQDTTAPAGTTQTYRIRVKDVYGNTLTSNTATIAVPTGGTSSVYANAVTADGATHLWRLGEGSGTTGYDYVAADDQTIDSSSTRGADGAMVNDATAKSTTFTGGATVPSASTVAAQVAAPNTYAEEAWFKTTSTSGGKILGFGNSNTGTSNNYDRHIYLTNDGRITYGVYTGNTVTLSSGTGFNDGQWHQVVANMSSAGMELFVDGKRIGRDVNTTAGQPYSGWWRIGGDNIGGWPNQPSSNSLAGSIEDVAIYAAPLSLSQVQNHYQSSGRNLNLPTRPTDAYGAAVWDSSPSFYWRLDEAQGVNAATDRMTNTTTGTYSSGVVRGEAGAPANSAGTSIRLPGDSTQTVVSTTAVNNPTVYSTEVWFKTTSTNGGRLIGFGNSNDPNGTSSGYDRYIWMQNDGTLRYGIYTGNTVTVQSPAAYNDGQWHQTVATQSSDGMKLYVDGSLVGSDPTTTPQNYTGYWRLGTDNVWFGANTANFAGSLDEAAVYDTALPASTISQHWQLGKPAAANVAPTAAFTSTTSNLQANFDGSGSADSDGTIAGYAWQFGDGSTGTGVSPSHTYASANTYTVGLTVTDDKGATTTVTKTVTVTQPANQLPVAAFTSSVNKLKATFDGSSSSDPDGTIASYAWDFGDGGTGTGATPNHTYATAGSYTVGLTVTDDRGGATLVTHSVAVIANAAPAAAFSNTCTNLACTFDGSTSTDSDGTIASYAWNFGDGGTSTVQKPSYTYATAGTRSVTLTVTDNDGATNTATQTVTVSPANNPPTAAFTSTVTDLTVAFDGSTSTDSDGTVASYAWNFGDGGTATTQKPSYTYTTAGDKTVTLVVTDDKGATNTVSRVVTVTAPNQKPVAAFTASCTQLACSFDGTTSSDPDGTVASYAWNFGDNTTGTGPTTNHTYTAGTYTVTLTVTDDKGATGTATRTVSPATTPPPNQAPTSAFTAGTSGLTASLDGTTSSDPDGTVVSWAWSFGDGTTGTGATTTHPYATGGTYTVTLTVTDDKGATGVSTKSVTVTAPPVNQPPVAAFTATSNNLAASFDASGSSDPDGTIASYAWAFADGTSGTGKTVSHTYAAAGTYNVVLTVTDNQGAATSITRAVTVASGPTTLATDAFGRTVASGFGAADSGGNWTATGTKLTSSVSGGVGVATVQLGATGYLRLPGVSNLNTDVLHSVSLDAMPTGGGAYLGTIVRSTAAGDYYSQVLVKSTGVVQIYMSRTGATIGSVITVPGLTYTAGTKLNVRAEAIGSGPTTLRAKVWLASGTEPAAWQVSVTDSTAGYQVAGGVGFIPYDSSSATTPFTARYDDLKVTTVN